MRETINNLRPCPKCKGTRAVLKVRHLYGSYYYVCKTCGYSPEIAHSLDEAVMKWNDERKADRCESA